MSLLSPPVSDPTGKTVAIAEHEGHALSAPERVRGERLVHDLNNALMVAMGSLGMLQLTLEGHATVVPHMKALEMALQRIATRLESFDQACTRASDESHQNV